MIKSLALRSFKSWHDLQALDFGPITGLFGPNSSGKTSLLQALLLLKQTVDSSDRGTILNFGNKNTAVNLDGFYNVISDTGFESSLEISIKWKPDHIDYTIFRLQHGLDEEIEFSVKVRDQFGILVDQMQYFSGDVKVGMVRNRNSGNSSGSIYQSLNHRSISEMEYSFLNDSKIFSCSNDGRIGETSGTLANPSVGTPVYLPKPIKCYGFPSEMQEHIKDARVLKNLALNLEKCMQSTYYIGPIRAHPERRYIWKGSRPTDVGRFGEFTVEAMLASKMQGDIAVDDDNHTLEQHVAKWLQNLGLVHSFRVKKIEGRDPIFDVLIKQDRNSKEIHLADMGFGVSQVLPVLVLCYYVPRGSTIILEQPEIHLHPAVQADLADLLIDVSKKRNVQILLESHSEHLLRRLQRRVAEERITNDDVRLYFCSSDQGASRIEMLELDDYGNIANWPKEFFGDEFGEIFTTSEAVFRRKREAKK